MSGEPAFLSDVSSVISGVQCYLDGKTVSPETNYSVRLLECCLGDEYKVGTSMLAWHTGMKHQHAAPAGWSGAHGS